MARPKGFEPLTPRFVVWCSIQLSYGRVSLWALGARMRPKVRTAAKERSSYPLRQRFARSGKAICAANRRQFIGCTFSHGRKLDVRNFLEITMYFGSSLRDAPE
jgi:hypothetical protein